jgi:AcrR family transcriptional regulator
MADAVRPYHHGSLRRELLERAEQALAEAGPQRLSLREIARDIGVSHAAPRRHFPDKQALLDALAESGFMRLGAELDAADARAAAARATGTLQSGTFRARLTAVARAYIAFATEHGALLELMYATKHRPGAPDLESVSQRAFATPIAVIAEGQRDGDVVPGDPERVATVTWATIHGIASMAASRLLKAPVDQVVADAVERLELGLRPRATTGETPAGTG